MRFFIKYFVIFPIVFFGFGAYVAFFENDLMAKEYGQKTNIIHDYIGAKVLTENKIEFVKIIQTKGKDVAFCDDKRNLNVYFSKSKKIVIKKLKSPKCGKVLTQDGVAEDNGLGQVIGSIITLLDEKEKENAEKKLKADEDIIFPITGPQPVKKQEDNVTAKDAESSK